MDPVQKQELKYTAKHVFNIVSDKTSIAMAKLARDDTTDIDVALVKATIQEEVVPKEKHVKYLKVVCSGSSPRQVVDHVIHGLARRLDEADGWLVSLKTLIVFHRLFREVDVSFQDECLRYAERTGLRRLLRRENFADHTTKETWDYSAWIRCYSIYLDERLSTYRMLKWDPEAEGAEQRDSKLKNCDSATLLEMLPQVQKLLGRLVLCIPEGAAARHAIVLLACSMVLKELRSVYKASCEGIINLADKYFEMERTEAMRGLELYKENLVLNERMNMYFNAIQAHAVLRGATVLPELQPLPADFLGTMEEYVRDAPKVIDPNQAPIVTRKAGTPAMTASASMALRGSATSSALTGAPVDMAPPSMPVAIPSAAPAAATADLLDFGDLVINDHPAPIPVTSSSMPIATMNPAASTPAASWDAFGAGAVANPFGDDPFHGTKAQSAPMPVMPSPVTSSPPNSTFFDPFGASSGHHQPPPAAMPVATHSPPVSSGPGVPPPIDPFLFTSPVPANAHGSMPPYSTPPPSSAQVPLGGGNPFAASASFSGSSTVNPFGGGNPIAKRSPGQADPLLDLSMDMFGMKNNATGIVQPSLRDLKATSGTARF